MARNKQLLQSAKRRTRGCRSFSSIRTVIFLIVGKLAFTLIKPHVAHPHNYR